MEELGKVHQLIVPIMGYKMVFNLEVIAMTWIVIIILLVFGFLAARKKVLFPSSLQLLGELLVSGLYGLTEDALDKKMAKTYGPLTCALFMFLVISNWLGIIPFL